MSIILKNRKKKFFFKFLKIKLSAKGLLQPLLFAEAVGCSLLWGAEGGAVSWQPASSCQGEELVSRAVIWRGAA